MISVMFSKRAAVSGLSALLMLPGLLSVSTLPSAGQEEKKPADSADFNFSSSQKWSIVPADSARAVTKSPERRQNRGLQIQQGAPAGSFSGAAQMIPPYSPADRGFQSRGATPSGAVQVSRPTETKTLKLYGRIEELCRVPGAKIPLKMKAMTPIRDASLDVKIAANSMAGQATFMAPGRPLTPLTAGTQKIQNQQTLNSQVERQQQPERPQQAVPEFPREYRGDWSGEMTVYLVDFDSSYFDFDRKEAEKQQQLMTTGRKGYCTVSFRQGIDNKIEMQPTKIIFSAPLATAVQDMSQARPEVAALAGLLGAGGKGMLDAQVPEFALPLGNISPARGVTGNQLSNELMKNTLKEISQGVLEQQVVTRDCDQNQSGQVKITFTENDLRFTRLDSDSLSLQAAAVTYDSHGGYLNKVVLTGTLRQGAPTAPSGGLNVLGLPIPGGSGSAPNSSGANPGASNLFGNLFGNPSQSGGDSGNPSSGDPGSGSDMSNIMEQVKQIQKMGQSGNTSGNNSSGGSGSGTDNPVSNIMDQMKQVEKMLKEMP